VHADLGSHDVCMCVSRVQVSYRVHESVSSLCVRVWPIRAAERGVRQVRVRELLGDKAFGSGQPVHAATCGDSVACKVVSSGVNSGSAAM
jgi:hypothetical protein